MKVRVRWTCCEQPTDEDGREEFDFFRRLLCCLEQASSAYCSLNMTLLSSRRFILGSEGFAVQTVRRDFLDKHLFSSKNGSHRDLRSEQQVLHKRVGYSAPGINHHKDSKSKKGNKGGKKSRKKISNRGIQYDGRL